MRIIYSPAKKTDRVVVISPQQFARVAARGVTLPPRAVFCPLPWMTKYMLSQGTYEPVHVFGEIYTDQKRNVCFIALAGCGGPAAALQTELAIACGVQQAIFVGTAGSLQEEVLPGDLVLCRESVCADGTSPHYTHQEMIPSHKQLTAQLAAALRAEKLSFHQGRNWSTDALLRETKAEIKHYQKLSVLSVDMETSAFLAVCARRKIAGAAAYVVSDCVGNGTWQPDLQNPLIKKNLRRLLSVSQQVPA